MDADLELELRKLIAERDIRRQLFRYQEAINRADYAEMEAFFGAAKIATMGSANADELHGVIDGGRQFADGFRHSTQSYDGSPMVQYSACNITVDVSDDLDTATCHAYYFIFQALGTHNYANPDEARDFPLQPIGCGRYYDTYRNIDGRWQIVEREIYSDLSGDYSRHMRISPAAMADDGGLLDQIADSGLQPKVENITSRSVLKR
jgi:hypothetical protein